MAVTHVSIEIRPPMFAKGEPRSEWSATVREDPQSDEAEVTRRWKGAATSPRAALAAALHAVDPLLAQLDYTELHAAPELPPDPPF